MYKIGFDNDKYISLQSEKIKERIAQFDGKLYLEFGGKLFDDYHASRVLPGFAPDSKIRMLLQLKDQAEVVIVINASDIEKNKVRGDLGISYDQDVLRLIDALRKFDIYVGSVVLTRYLAQPAAEVFMQRLEAMGIRVYKHYSIPGYPSQISTIVSEEGFGKNDYIETSRSLVVVTAPGPGSGKMATCLSQLYHDHKRGINSGYAKFETFPVWNLPLKHPVNIAYEAATADLDDVNMIDPFHLEAYGVMTVNYNRDVEIFPVLEATFKRIYGASPYKSPTDMGVNMAGCCIFDQDAVKSAARSEILRRYYNAMCDVKRGLSNGKEADKIKLILDAAAITADEYPVIGASLNKAEQTGAPAAAIQLPDGRIITGKTSSLLGAASAMLLNALKALGGIDDDRMLISPDIITPIQNLKINNLGNRNPRLHTDETLVALSICAATDPVAALAMQQLHKLKNCPVHTTVIISSADLSVLKKLGTNVTCEPLYETKSLFHK